MDNLTLYIKGSRLFIPKVREGIKIKEHRPLEGRILCGTISKTPTGKYYASITVEKEITPLVETNKAVGIDLGVKDFVILSTGEKVNNPKFKRTQRRKLKFLHKNLSKKKGSKNKEKARKKLAKKYEKITNKKQNFLHKLSNKIINENQVICLEDLNIKGMVKNHNLADSIHEVSWYEFVR